jgi:hypothetical protein
LLPTPLLSLTRGLLWRKYSINDCTVLYFSELKRFRENFEATTYIRAPSRNPTHDATRLVAIVDMPQNVRRWWSANSRRDWWVTVRKWSFSATYVATERR